MSNTFSEIVADLQPPTTLAAIQRSWKQIVGGRISEIATPVSERAGTLTISCTSAGWAQELDLLSGQIIPSINQQLGYEAVIKLKPQATNSA
jgi:predicted nucleic acid-binding Zn ribbon protein